MGQVIQFRPRRAAGRPMYEDVVLAARLASVTTAVWIVLSLVVLDLALDLFESGLER
jgi:hypothetical protein